MGCVYELLLHKIFLSSADRSLFNSLRPSIGVNSVDPDPQSCADQGIFVKGGGGGGGGVQVSLTGFFFFLFFFSPQLILQKSNGQFQRNLSFFKVPEGVQLFSRVVQLLIPYRNPYKL